MKIHTVRHGFATNSSSSHSIISGTASWHDMTPAEIVQFYLGIDKIPEMYDCYDLEVHDTLESVITYAIIATGSTEYSLTDVSQIETNARTILLAYADKNTVYWNTLEAGMKHAKPGEFSRVFWEFVYSVSAIEIEDRDEKYKKEWG